MSRCHRHLFHSKNICPLLFLNETSACGRCTWYRLKLYALFITGENETVPYIQWFVLEVPFKAVLLYRENRNKQICIIHKKICTNQNSASLQKCEKCRRCFTAREKNKQLKILKARSITIRVMLCRGISGHDRMVVVGLIYASSTH